MQCWTVRERAEKGIMVELIEDDGKEVLGIAAGKKYFPVSRSIQKLVDKAIAVGIYKEAADVKINRIRFSNDHKYLVPEGKTQSDSALVLCSTSLAPNGSIYYNSEVFAERVDKSGRVRRRHDPLERATGIKVVLEDEGENGPEKLILMRPNASFRIVRTGDVDNAAPVLVVKWTGSRITVRERYSSKRRVSSSPTSSEMPIAQA